MLREERIQAFEQGMAHAYRAVRDEVEWLKGNGCLTERTEHAMSRAGVFMNAEGRDLIARADTVRRGYYEYGVSL